MRERKHVGLTAKSFIFALLVHGIVLAMLLVSFRWNTELVAGSAGKKETEPVKATVVSEEEVQQQLAELEAEEERKRQEEIERQQRLEEAERQAQEAEQRRKEETERLAEIERQRKAEQEKAEKLAAQRKAEQDKAEKLAAQRKAEEERLARIKKEKEQAEAERRAEQERLAALEKQKQEEARRQAEAERRRKEEEERRRAEEALQAKLEQERVTRRVNEAASHYVPLIQQKVTRNWRREASCKSGIEVIVEVRLLPSGEVVSANVVRSSGDQACDRSVETAVWKASPLPISPDPSVYQRLFRQFNFRFKPDEKLLSQQ